MTAHILLDSVGRQYGCGAGSIRALDTISLSVESGEMIAIMGPSGCGKSTLLNILGCIDHPTSGRYLVDGLDMAALDSDGRAQFRRTHFGFVFQRYFLVSGFSALDNIEMPALYTSRDRARRRQRSGELLRAFRLETRANLHPNVLSGGEQQRVGIARALFNDARTLLADEPTGALDCSASDDVVALFHDLHQAGRTVIVVTHDLGIARQAPRIIEMLDGRIIADRRQRPAAAAVSRHALASVINDDDRANATTVAPLGTRLFDAIHIALRALIRHRVRTGLSVLGILIGITAVMGTLALGGAVRRAYHQSFQSQAGHLTIVQGRAHQPVGVVVRHFDDGDIDALSAIPGVSLAEAASHASLYVTRGSRTLAMSVVGMAPDEPARLAVRMAAGRPIGPLDLESSASVVVLSSAAREILFEGSSGGPGETIVVGGVPFEIVGVMAPANSVFSDGALQDALIVPSSTFRRKLQTSRSTDELDVFVADAADTAAVSAQAQRVLDFRHGRRDFRVFNVTEAYESARQFAGTLQLVMSAIAVVSLVVGGVGIMNIMWVSIAERTQEIGVHIAIGARQRDLRLQFLVEAMTLCVLGGGAGVALTWLLCLLARAALPGVAIEPSFPDIVIALTVAFVVGMLAGYLPARYASRLQPAEALVRD